METLSCKLQTARKQHKCDMCNRIINPKDKYYSSFVVDGGDHWQWKECIYCNELIPKLFTNEELSYGIGQDDFENVVWDKVNREQNDCKISLSLAVEMLYDRMCKK